MQLTLSHELLDDDAGTPDEVRRSLADIWWINQHLGGVSTWRKLLDHFAARGPLGPLSLLDVGAGTGQVTTVVANALRQRGAQVTSFVADRRASHCGAAAGAAIAADAFQLPLADHSVDVVVCNLFLHHFHDTPGDAAATRLLQSLHRVARRAVIVNDLERAWLPYLFIRLLAPRFSRITRNDGPASVRQAYTAAELSALARRAGFTDFEVVKLWPFRLGLMVWKHGG